MLTTLGRRWQDLALAAGLFLTAVLMVSLHVDAYPKVSPVDELQHIDYLYNAPSAPAPGDRVGQEAMNEQACRGLDVPGHPVPPCRPKHVYDPNSFQESGFNTASINSPVYYTMARALGETIAAVTPVDNLVTGGRLAGALWLGLGVALTFAAARLRGAGRWAALAVSALLLSAPALLYPASTINPDGQGLLWGALVILLLTFWERVPSRGRGALLVAAAGVATLVKLTNIGAVAAVCLYLLVAAWLRWREGDKDKVRAPLVLATVTGAASLGLGLAWMVVQNVRDHYPTDEVPAMTTRFDVPSFPWIGLLESPPQVLTPLGAPWVLVGDPRLAYFDSRIVSAILLAGVLAAALFGAGHVRDQWLARAAVTSAIALTLGLVTMNYLTTSDYFPLPGRYGASLVALMAVSAAVCLRQRAALVAVSLAATLCLALGMYSLVTL